MKMKKMCENCLKEVDCIYNERIKEIEYANKKIKFKEKYYVCCECNEEFYDDLHDDNVIRANDEIRKVSGLIRIEEIKEILEKYNIGKKPLSLVLGLGEITITRYLDGQNPTRENSELLKNILENPWLYEMYLMVNKDKLTTTAYKKSLGKTKQIEMINDKSKLYNVALYIIDITKEIDALSLQKLLYFSNGLSHSFFGTNLIGETAESWKYGPVYKDIYDCFSYYQYNKIDYNELCNNVDFELSTDEKKYLDAIIECFGCYSGAILREMTHLTEPWVNARAGLSADESSNRVIDINEMNLYFDRIYKEYKMSEFCDIRKYSEELFENAKNRLFRNFE